MAPALVTVDLSPDLDFAATSDTSSNGMASRRTLLVAPPSMAAHEEKLHAVYATFDRSASDLHMLDRLSAGLGALPPATYDLVVVLTGAGDELRAEAAALLGRDVLGRLVPAMRPGARLAAQHGGLGDLREAVLAGLVADRHGGYTKPDYAEEEAVPLRFGKTNKKSAATTTPAPTITTTAAPPVVKATPQGVGFVDLDDDLGEYESGDELVPEDDLMTEEERNRPIQKPPACPPGRKRACKDCTCGLAARLEKEDQERRKRTDQTVAALKLASDDLNELELDLTVKGKTGSCNSCSLGDAFRCAGLPPFQPGSIVQILDNAPQL